MTEQAKTKDAEAAKTKVSSEPPLGESELETVAGGFTQDQYDKWEAQGPADRTDHGPGSGE